MKYEKIWAKVLNPDEKVKYEFSISDKYCRFLSVPFIIYGLLMSVVSLAFALLVISFALIYFEWYLKISNAYAFTNKRVLVHKGWLSTHLTSVDYEKITDIKVQEPLLDRLFWKSGSLIINTAGTGFHEIVLTHIKNPYETKKKLDNIRKS